MIIKLVGADFSQSNIGTLSTYSIRYDSTGVTNNNTTVDRDTNTGYSATITFKENYELNGAITVTMGGVDITSTAVSGLNINIAKVTGNVVITVPAKSTVVEPETPTMYTFTINPTPTSAAVTLTASGYTTVSGTGAQSISVTANTAVSYSVTADGYSPASGSWTVTGDKSLDVSLSTLDDEGTITWSNNKYQSGTGLVSAANRACAKITAVSGERVVIYRLEDYVPVDLIAFDENGAATGYISATSSSVGTTNTNGTMTFIIPSTSTFTNAVAVGLVIKKSDETNIDISTLPTTYYHNTPAITNHRFDSKETFTFISDNTRFATTYVEVGANKTVTISDIPTDYSDLVVVDCVEYKEDKTYIKYSSSATSQMNDTTMTITLPSSLNTATAYVRLSMKRSTASSDNIYSAKMINCTITSA